MTEIYHHASTWTFILWDHCIIHVLHDSLFLNKSIHEQNYFRIIYNSYTFISLSILSKVKKKLIK